MKDIPKVEVESLNLSVGKRTLQLSMDEARRLYTALDGIFGKSYTCYCKAYHVSGFGSSSGTATYTVDASGNLAVN